jgi:hypothetical protein
MPTIHFDGDGITLAELSRLFDIAVPRATNAIPTVRPVMFEIVLRGQRGRIYVFEHAGGGTPGTMRPKITDLAVRYGETPGTWPPDNEHPLAVQLVDKLRQALCS